MVAGVLQLSIMRQILLIENQTEGVLEAPKESEYDQKILQQHTADQSTVL